MPFEYQPEVINELEYRVGNYIRLKGYLSWLKGNSSVQLHIINEGLMRLLVHKKLRVDVVWGGGQSSILINPHPFGMVPLRLGLDDVYCNINRLISVKQVLKCFNQKIVFKPIEILWYGNPKLLDLI